MSRRKKGENPLAPILKRPHHALVREVLIACNRLHDVFVFPVDVTRVVGRKRTLGMSGTPDIIGWREKQLGVPIFVALECKVGRDRLRPLQRAFLDMVVEAGGVGLEIRNVEDAIKALTA